MSPARKESLARWLPLGTILISIIAGIVGLASRVSALEVRAQAVASLPERVATVESAAKERKDDIAEIRSTTRRIEEKIDRLMGARGR